MASTSFRGSSTFLVERNPCEYPHHTGLGKGLLFLKYCPSARTVRGYAHSTSDRLLIFLPNHFPLSSMQSRVHQAKRRSVEAWDRIKSWLVSETAFAETLPNPMKFHTTIGGSVLAFLVATLIADDSSSLQAQSSQAASVAIPETDEGLPGAGPIRRYAWFQNLWLEKRTKWATEVDQDQSAVVFFGDSITQGWGKRLETHFSEMKVANRGISGDTTRGLLIRLREDVLSLNPSAVVLLIGTNDLEEGATPATIASNMELILAELKGHRPSMPIILNLVFPSSASKKRPSNLIKDINKRYKALVKGDPQVTLVETWELFASAEGDAKKEEFPDLLHPNDLGYAKWAAGLRPLFATLGLLETKPDSFQLEPGFRSLFNGYDLSGWGFKTNRLDGLTSSISGRYVAKNGRLIVTTPPEYRRFQQLWTTESFGSDFVLRLDFRATPFADSGVFIRKPQLQCRDYGLAGPFKYLKNYRPQDWNSIEVTVKGGIAFCTSNGEVLNEAMEVPPTGPIGLEGDRGQMEYRRIRIKTVE